MDYFKKYDHNPAEDLKWNIPERKQGIMAVIGSNSQSFRTSVKVAEWLSAYPLESINVILPDALKNKLPSVPSLVFLGSTDSGSFANADELSKAIDVANSALLIGDLSKNTTTARAVATACQDSTKPLFITRDAVDLISDYQPERTLLNQNLVLMASIAQLQKLLRAMYYPKMLMPSQPLVQVAETLHKFTLSYPTAIITLHNNQILMAYAGNVAAVPLDKTNFSPLTFWSGELLVKISVFNLFNPNNFINATLAGLF